MGRDKRANDEAAFTYDNVHFGFDKCEREAQSAIAQLFQTFRAIRLYDASNPSPRNRARKVRSQFRPHVNLRINSAI